MKKIIEISKWALALTFAVLCAWVESFIPSSGEQLAIAPVVAAALISAAPSVISGIGGLFGKKKKEKQLQASLAPYRKMLDELTAQQKGGYLNSTEGAGLVNKIGQSSDNQRFQLSSLAGLNGMTDEAQLSGLDNINKNEGNSLASLAMNGNNYRSNLSSQRQGILGNILGFETGQRNFNRAQNTNAINANANMGMGLAQLLMQGGGDYGSSGGSFSSSGINKYKSLNDYVGGLDKIGSPGKVPNLTFGF